MSRREFRFTEGTSQKFWAIEVKGSGFTVQFGRLGTAGQTQTKEFASADAARKAADKLIAEKTGKGYVEVGGAAAATTTATAAPANGKKKRKTAAEPEAVAAPPPAAPAVTRRIDLEPRDWLWATWRSRQPLPKPERLRRPFDQAKAVERLRGAAYAYGFQWGILAHQLRPPFSREEGQFWLVAVSSAPKERKAPEKFIAGLAKMSFDGQISPADVVARIGAMKDAEQGRFRCLVRVLPALLPPADLIALTLGDDLPADQSWLPLEFTHTLLDEILPTLTADEIASLQPLVRPRLDPKKYPPDYAKYEQPAFRLAAALGMAKELEAVVAGWPADYFKDAPWTEAPQWTLFGLGNPARVDLHMRRLNLRLKNTDHARAWLAHTEYGGLDLLRDSIIEGTNKQWVEQMVEVFCLVRAPEAAPPLLELRLAGKSPNLVSAWFEENPGNAMAGVIPTAAGKGKLADAAVEYLRAAKKQGHGDFIAEQLKGAPADVAAKVRAAVLEHEEKVYEPLDAKATPKPLRDAFTASSAAAGLPAWAAPQVLPPILVGGRRLLDVQVSAVLDALRRTPLGSTDPLLTALKEHADAPALDAFAWGLCERWLAEGAPTKEKWALAAVGHLGGDSSVMKLTPLVRAWPGENQHPRAVLGLDCLRAVGTDTALMQLNGIAQKLKFQGLKNKAKEYMEAIAADKGLSREELEDRIVPDLDLDERGSRVLDFGPRQFKVALAPDLTPKVRDADGKVLADLPKPGAKDDPAKANAAVEEWKLLKKQLRDALKVQTLRLEQAMVTGRRWPVEQFEALLVRHPLMTHLAQRVLWGAYDKAGKLRDAFRVTEEQDCAGADDRPFALKGAASVGIVHPLHLTEAQRAAWGEVFADYEIITPFPQLGRPVLAPDKAEAKGKMITRLSGAALPPTAARGTLERLGWVRGSAADHGMIQEFYKDFPAAGVTALLEVEPGIPLGMADWAEPQKVPRVFFLPSPYQPLDYPNHKETKFVALSKVDAVAVSEVLADLTALASKAT
jgi:predicted DNA-binding WGR domain protein